MFAARPEGLKPELAVGVNVRPHPGLLPQEKGLAVAGEFARIFGERCRLGKAVLKTNVDWLGNVGGMSRNGLRCSWLEDWNTFGVNSSLGKMTPVGKTVAAGATGLFSIVPPDGAVYWAIPQSTNQISPRLRTVSSLSNKTELLAAIAVGSSSESGCGSGVFIAGFDIMKGLRNTALQRGDRQPSERWHPAGERSFPFLPAIPAFPRCSRERGRPPQFSASRRKPNWR